MTSSLSAANSSSTHHAHQNSYSTHASGSSRRSYNTQTSNGPSQQDSYYQQMDPVSYARILYEHTRRQMDSAASQTTPLDRTQHNTSSRSKSGTAMA